MTTDLAFNITESPMASNVSVNLTSDDMDEVIANRLRLVTLPLIVLCGTIGNVLTFLVLIRRRMRVTSVYFYLTVLSCSDTLVLYVSGFKTWITEVTEFEFMRISDATCKITIFLILLGLYSSSWMIVLLTVDRCVAVCFPLRAAWLCSVQHARRLSLVLFIVICLYNLHVFWTFGLFFKGDRFYCHANPDLPFMGNPFEILKLASYSFIPFALVLTMNCAIIYQIRVARYSIGTQSSSRSGDSSSANSNHNRVTYMLLTVSFTWFLMTAPFSIQFFGIVASNKVGKTLVFLVMYLNHSVNFFLYCLTGRKFRRELRELFGFCRRQRTPHNGFELKSKATDKSFIGHQGDNERTALRVSIDGCRCNGDAQAEL